jgi:PKD repeat protein
MVKKVSRDACAAVKVCVVVFFVMFAFGVVIVEAADTSISINPVSQSVSAGAAVSIIVNGVPEQPVKAFELKVSFNPSLLQVTSVSEGDLFDGYTTFFNPGIINNVAGTIVNVYDLIVGPGNVTDAGVLVTINFTARSTSGTSPLSLYDVRVTNETDYIAVSVSSASVTVTGGSSPPPYTPPPSEPPVTPPPSSPNQPPSTPLEPSGPLFIEVGTSYEYTDSSVDPDGDQVRLRFDWGDGSLSNWTGFVASNTSVAASHAWGNVSTYVIRVIAQDENGSNSSWSDPLPVVVSQAGSEGSPPVGGFNMSQNASLNQTIVFDASGMFDPDGVIVSYLWDFGDGVTGEGENPSHTYQFPGEYTVTLTVTDNAGQTFSTTRVVSIAASAEVPTEEGNSFLQSNGNIIILLVALVAVVIFLLLSRNKIQELFLQKRIETTHRRLVQIDRSTADIDEIVDALFLELKDKTQTPSKRSIQKAYNDLMRGKVEKNPAFIPPDLSIEEVEKRVDRRIQAKIEDEIDKM